jgi:hypothetical protein
MNWIYNYRSKNCMSHKIQLCTPFIVSLLQTIVGNWLTARQARPATSLARKFWEYSPWETAAQAPWKFRAPRLIHHRRRCTHLCRCSRCLQWPVRSLTPALAALAPHASQLLRPAPAQERGTAAQRATHRGKGTRRACRGRRSWRRPICRWVSVLLGAATAHLGGATHRQSDWRKQRRGGRVGTYQTA